MQQAMLLSPLEMVVMPEMVVLEQLVVQAR
jgi:hypothetical protein